MKNRVLTLGSIDAIGRVLHRSPIQLDVRCGHRRGCPFLDAASFFFFLKIHANSALIRIDSCQTRPIRPELGCIDQIESNRPMVETDRNDRSRLKSAFNHAGTAEIGFE